MRSPFPGRLAAVVVLLVAACASVAPPAADREAALNVIAEDYVHLILEIGEHEPGYVDAYYGPEEWPAEAKAELRSVPELTAAATTLLAEIEAVPEAGLTPSSASAAPICAPMSRPPTPGSA